MPLPDRRIHQGWCRNRICTEHALRLIHTRRHLGEPQTLCHQTRAHSTSQPTIKTATMEYVAYRHFSMLHIHQPHCLLWTNERHLGTFLPAHFPHRLRILLAETRRNGLNKQVFTNPYQPNPNTYLPHKSKSHVPTPIRARRP